MKKEKLIEFAKSVDVPMLAFIALNLRMFFLGASYQEAIALVSLSALYAYKIFLVNKDSNWKKLVEKEIIDLRNVISSIKIKQNAKYLYGEKEPGQAKSPVRFF